MESSNYNDRWGGGGGGDRAAAGSNIGGGKHYQRQGRSQAGHGGRGQGKRGEGFWSGKGWDSVPLPSKSEKASQPSTYDSHIPDIQSLKISEQQSPSSFSGSTDKEIIHLKRPDRGGTLSVNSNRLLVNYFPVRFNPEKTIMHYGVTIKMEMSPGSRSVKRSLPKLEMALIKDKLFSDDPIRFPERMIAYDGDRNFFSAVPLPTGQLKVELSDGEEFKNYTCLVNIKLLNELNLSKLRDYLNGNLLYIPRDILHGMDVVMKKNPSKYRISVARSFFSTEFKRQDDLNCGIAAFRGFQQSLKPTAQGLSLCLDYSVLTFCKKMPVLDFLKEHVRGFRGVYDVLRLRKEVETVLKGLKVFLTHRVTKQKYVVAGLTYRITRDLTFMLQEGKGPPKEVSLVEYFREKYDKEILHKDIPCLELGKNNKKNHVPMEFCILVGGQRYPKDRLDEKVATSLKKISRALPEERKSTICEMMRSWDGPCGDDTKNFEIEVEKDMTRVVGRVIMPPDLKLGTPDGNSNILKVDKDTCHWNLVGRSLVEAKPIERWAIIDFSSSDRLKLHHEIFIPTLITRCRSLGIHMKEPVVYHPTNMRILYNVTMLQELLESVIDEADEKCRGRLQIILCVMATKHRGYKYLKWISETRIGVVTQCCLSVYANKCQDQFLSNLALKINAKLGGSNAELTEQLAHFGVLDYVMFVGADVNHPVAKNSTSPSIAAVVATVNWPAANRYAARVCPQDHRNEKIQNFGKMCLDLVHTYGRLNKVKPKKIVIFRDGVSESQFDMVLNEELADLKRVIYDESYRPTITLVLAQKRHQTRLFLEDEKWGAHANVPPGTVVDTTVIHPFEFDFYLCSHYGSLGTSRPTHYYVLWDEHFFTSDQLQKLVYDLCYTFARCTKPVSLVPPVYYADLVAYRGRLFQEVVRELQSPSSSAALSALSSSSSSSSYSAASFDEKFYKLHPELQNVMFFI